GLAKYDCHVHPLWSHSGAREARTRNLEVPGSMLRIAPERLLLLRDRRLCHRGRVKPRNQSFLDRLDLQRELFRADPALRKAAGDEPETGLAGAHIHVAQLLVFAKTPDPADAF